jgi:hypothetical protein
MTVMSQRVLCSKVEATAQPQVKLIGKLDWSASKSEEKISLLEASMRMSNYFCLTLLLGRLVGPICL